MKAIDLSAVEDVQEFARLKPGGYICGITRVEDNPEREFLLLEYDIAEGPFANYWRQLCQSKGFWGGSFVKSYKERALPFFKSFVTAVENSNRGYRWDNDETKLKRKIVGLVLGEEEYLKKDGTVGTRLYVDQIHSVERIKAGEYKTPDFKRLSVSPAAEVTYPSGGSGNAYEEVVTDDDLPF